MLIIIQDMEYRCPQKCQVLFLSELYVCEEPSCFVPQIRCKDCFRKCHTTPNETTGVWKVHDHKPFDESILWRNFLSLIKLYEIFERRMKANFGQFTDNYSYLATIAFFSGPVIQELFSNQELMHSFSVLKQIYYKRQASFNQSPSIQLQTALYQFTDKKYQKIIEQINRPTYEDILLEQNIIYACGNKGQWVEHFISKEQELFSEYCEQLRQKKQGLNIMKYLSERRKTLSTEEIYYSRDFENFMEDHYEKKPEEKGLFTLSEYSRHVWAHITTHFIDPNIKHYFQQWVEAHNEYSKILKEQGEEQEEHISNFRIWKEQYYPHTEATLKNIYFIEVYIIGYIQHLMFIKNYGIKGSKIPTWVEFGEYLKDFTSYMEIKELQFLDMYNYRLYYIFRSEQAGTFFEHIRNSPDITFNRAYAIEYMNIVYKDEGKITLKGYKKYVTTKTEELSEKNSKIDNIVNGLKGTLIYQEGQKFYLSVYNSFVTQAIEEEIEINKENYLLYKSKVLEKFDEKAIRIENEELEEVVKYNEEQNNEEGTVKKSEDPKIRYEIDEDQKYMHDAIENSSSEDEGIQISEHCPCCNGDPDNCQSPECQMMNYCVTCSL